MLRRRALGAARGWKNDEAIAALRKVPTTKTVWAKSRLDAGAEMLAISMELKRPADALAEYRAI